MRKWTAILLQCKSKTIFYHCCLSHSLSIALCSEDLWKISGKELHVYIIYHNIRESNIYQKNYNSWIPTGSEFLLFLQTCTAWATEACKVRKSYCTSFSCAPHRYHCDRIVFSLHVRQRTKQNYITILSVSKIVLKLMCWSMDAWNEDSAVVNCSSCLCCLGKGITLKGSMPFWGDKIKKQYFSTNCFPLVHLFTIKRWLDISNLELVLNMRLRNVQNITLPFKKRQIYWKKFNLAFKYLVATVSAFNIIKFKFYNVKEMWRKHLHIPISNVFLFCLPKNYTVKSLGFLDNTTLNWKIRPRKSLGDGVLPLGKSASRLIRKGSLWQKCDMKQLSRKYCYILNL